ncbi:MAG: DUF2335 domain-containing protein [Rhodanobacter sp.]|jgi:uncharacterized membrane protein|nr:DUF2335 domain-containing protein [Rhodanobacter sp.]
MDESPAPQSIQVHTQTLVQQGPLPDPATLERYDRILPGAAERIIVMAEQEQRHRMDMDAKALEDDQAYRAAVLESHKENAAAMFRSDMLGQWMGGGIAVACVAGAIYSVELHAQWPVIAAFLSLPVAAIIKAVRSMNKPKP